MRLTTAGLPAPEAIGHRFVHGGDYDGPQLLTPDVLAELERLIRWAPQHQPAALGGVAAISKRWPDARQVGCFDSAFHRTMPTGREAAAAAGRAVGARASGATGFTG